MYLRLQCPFLSHHFHRLQREAPCIEMSFANSTSSIFFSDTLLKGGGLFLGVLLIINVLKTRISTLKVYSLPKYIKHCHYNFLPGGLFTNL